MFILGGAVGFIVGIVITSEVFYYLKGRLDEVEKRLAEVERQLKPENLVKTVFNTPVESCLMTFPLPSELEMAITGLGPCCCACETEAGECTEIVDRTYYDETGMPVAANDFGNRYQ